MTTGDDGVKAQASPERKSTDKKGLRTGQTSADQVGRQLVPTYVPVGVVSGVEEFTLKIARGPIPSTVYDVTATGAQNSAGAVPAILSIIGHDKSGGPGGEALLLEFDGGPLGCTTSDTYIVTASAKNFNNQYTNLTETIKGEFPSVVCTCE